jgi:hypothetical protein
MTALFTTPDAWAGGHFELAMALPDASDTVAAHALQALWATPQLDGSFARNDVEPHAQGHVAFDDLLQNDHLYGIATLAEGARCPCGSRTSYFEGEDRWLVLYLPLGALAEIFPLGGYPFGHDSAQLHAALRALHDWLRMLAVQLYEQIAFTIAVTGFESFFHEAKAQALHAIPAERWEGLLVPKGDQLRWYAPTRFGPQFS